LLAYLETVNFAIFSACFKASTAFSCYMVNLEKTYFPSEGFQPNYDNHLVLIRIASQWVDDVIFSNEIVRTAIHFAHDYFSATVTILIALYTLALLLLGVFLGARFLTSSRLLSSALTIAEQEFATPRALALLIFLMFCLVLATIGSSLFGANLTALQALYLTSIGSLLYLVALIPFNLIYN
jgi:hypothetical protein